MCQPAGPILLVEDETTDAMLFRRALEQITKDPPIIEIRNGDEAVEYLMGSGRYADRRKYPLPSLIVLDVKLPRRSGFEVLGWIRSQPDNLRFNPGLMPSSSYRSGELRKT